MAKRKNENAVTPDMSAEEMDALKAKKAEDKAKWDAKKKAQKEALQKVLEFALQNGDEAVQNAAKSLLRAPRQPREKTVGAPRATLTDICLELLGPEGKVHEDDLWTRFKLGRREAKWKFQDQVAKAVPSERLWVTFDATTGIYTFVAKGEFPPAGYAGYIPTKIKAEMVQKGIV